MVWDRGPISFFCIKIFRCPHTICWKTLILSPLNYLLSLVKNQLPTNVKVNFWTLNSIALGSRCLSSANTTSWSSVVNFEMKRLESSNFALFWSGLSLLTGHVFAMNQSSVAGWVSVWPELTGSARTHPFHALLSAILTTGFVLGHNLLSLLEAGSVATFKHGTLVPLEHQRGESLPQGCRGNSPQSASLPLCWEGLLTSSQTASGLLRGTAPGTPFTLLASPGAQLMLFIFTLWYEWCSFQ